MRDPDKLPLPSETLRVPVAIVGVGGLSAAWKLAKSGYKDFLLFELESKPGGNSRAGRNGVGEYPLSAHYLPLPPPEATAVRELLAELGVLQDDPRQQSRAMTNGTCAQHLRNVCIFATAGGRMVCCRRWASVLPNRRNTSGFTD